MRIAYHFANVSKMVELAKGTQHEMSAYKQR